MDSGEFGAKMSQLLGKPVTPRTAQDADVIPKEAPAVECGGSTEGEDGIIETIKSAIHTGQKLSKGEIE